MSTDRPQDDVIRAVARTRKGMTVDLLARLLDLRTADGDWDRTSARERLDGIKGLSFSKIFEDDRVFLHDKMYELTNKHVLKRLSPDDSGRAQEIILACCQERVAQARSTLEGVRAGRNPQAIRKETELLHAALAEDLHYQLRANAVHGFETYYRYAEEALQANDSELDAQLRAELLAFLAESDTNGEKSEVDGLQRLRVNADSAIRWVRRRIGANSYPEALGLVEIIEKEHLVLSDDRLSCLELSVWKLRAQVITAKDPASLEDDLEKTIAVLETLGDSWRVTSILAHAYNLLGYLRRTVGRQHAAIGAYGEAVRLWKIVELEAARATTLNNQAFALSNIGNFDRAKRLAEEALEIQERLGNRPAIGLGLNTSALIEMQDGDLDQALRLSKQALRKFKDAGDQRGIALAQIASAEILRRQATERKQLPAATAEGSLRQAISKAKTASRGFEKIKEQVRQVDALIQLGCAYRDLMYLYREYSGEQTVEELAGLATRAFEAARKLANEGSFQMLDAWVREAWMNYYLASYYRLMSRNPNLAHAADALAQVDACLDEANQLVGHYFPDYRITRDKGWEPRGPEMIALPVLMQIAKIELLNGQMAFNRFENLSQ